MKFPIRFAAALIFLPLSNAYPKEGENNPETITYLGVSTFHLPASLREHLEIADGFGVQIHEVVVNSPAEKAGLKENDILLKFKEQLLISPEHLSLLVRSEENASAVSLTLIRKGSQKQIEVTLGEIEQTDPQVRPRRDRYRMSPEQWQEHLKDQQDHWEEWMNKRQSRQDGKRHRSEEPEGDELGGRPPAVSVNPGFPVRVFGTEGVIKIDNEHGEVSITHEEEGHRITIRDVGGEEVYTGPYEADLGIESLPEAAQDHLRKMKLDNLKMLAPRIIEEAPEKTSSPLPSPTGTPEGKLM